MVSCDIVSEMRVMALWFRSGRFGEGVFYYFASSFGYVSEFVLVCNTEPQ